MRVVRRWKRAVLLALLLVLLGLLGWGLTGQVQAWRHYRAGVRALEQDDPDRAREHLQACVRVWHRSAEAHFLLARAARRCGELGEASRHLEEARRLEWVPEALELEQALLAVQAGEARAAEERLYGWLEAGHPESVLILEVLAPLYLRQFQLERAEVCVSRWLQLQPESPLAWHGKAVLATRRRNRDEAIKAYTREVQLGPQRHGSRLELAKLLLDRQRPAEAAEHLALVAKALPRDLDVMTELARLRDREGKPAEAARLLDHVLVHDRNNVVALHLRGKLAMNANPPDLAAAESLLRRAVGQAPFEPYLLHTWHLCLQRLGKGEEAREIQQRLKRTEDDLKRLSQLASYVARSPNRPDPRREIAAIYFRTGQDEQGLRWLETALRVAPDDPLTHHAFALYYEKVGQPHLAAPHRARSRKEAPAVP